MAWWDIISDSITNAIRSVTEVDKIINAFVEIPRRVADSATLVVDTAKELAADTEEFLRDVGGKAWAEFTDAQKAIYEGLIGTATKVITETTKIVTDPDVRKILLPELPEIKLPEIKLPDIPTPKDIINALTGLFKPLVDLLNELVKPMAFLRAQWVPVYDPFTRRIYYNIDEYLGLLPTYLARMGEVGKAIEMYKIEGGKLE